MYNNCWLCNAYLEEDEEFCLDCELSFVYEDEYFDSYYDSNIGLIDEELLESKGITLNLVSIDS